MIKPVQVSMELGGKTLTLETGKLAMQANGSVVATYGGTVVLATVVMSANPKEGMDFFPLTVEYEERFYAAGRIKTSRFMKREGRPSDESVLSGRMVDRAIRPLFNGKLRNEIQVVLTVLSFDGENDPDVLGLIAANAALSISDVPWNGPMGACRVGRINGEFLLNPTYEQRKQSDLDVIVAGPENKVLMLEVSGNEIPESDMYNAIMWGVHHFGAQLDLVKEFVSLCGKEKRVIEEAPVVAEESLEENEEAQLKQLAKDFVSEHIRSCLFTKESTSKGQRKAIIAELQERLETFLKEKQIGKEKRKICHIAYEEAVEEEVSRAIVEDDLRVDCRGIDEIRPLYVEVGVLPRTHGSALFMRGETQILSTVTLGSPSDEQLLENMEVKDEKKRYMHHYNFPPFSVGEVKPMRGPGRREIGHGALAEKAVVPMIPNKEAFPYTIRVVSEVLGSNGSSSMGATCGSTLALMSAGVPIKKPVAGIAMGLATYKGKQKVITDLQDLEDGEGGMDFKVTGTRDGITAIQLDTKTTGLSSDIVEEAITRAYKARLKVLDAMQAVIEKPNEQLSPFAPRIISFHIDPEKIGEVIGPSGKMINSIIDETGVAIDIEDDGLVMITSTDSAMATRAKELVMDIARVIAVGEVFTGPVSRIMEFGAFVDITGNQTGLVHISELAHHRVNRVEDVVKMGQVVTVKVVGIDDKGRINLSMKALQEPPKESREKKVFRKPFGKRPRE